MVFDNEIDAWNYADVYNDGRKDAGLKPARVYRVTHPALDDRLYVVHWDSPSAIGAAAERLKVSAILWDRDTAAQESEGAIHLRALRRLGLVIPEAMEREILGLPDARSPGHSTKKG
jgi:hypothetical protein